MLLERQRTLRRAGARTKLASFGLQLIIGEGLNLRFERVDIWNDGLEGAELLTFTAAENLFEHAHSGSMLLAPPLRTASLAMFSPNV